MSLGRFNSGRPVCGFRACSNLAICFRSFIVIALVFAIGAASADSEDGCECQLDKWAAPSPETKAWEYDAGCDFDVLDETPTQEVFDELYFAKKPVLIRNFTTSWHANVAWQKRALWDEFKARSVDHNVSHFNSNHHWVSYNTSAWIKNFTVADFLCHQVCKPNYGDNRNTQLYVFDRDDWFDAQPWMADDYEHFPLMKVHFDPDWHERWSRYFLVSAEGSGINFHQHTDAYNGLVAGWKRWFIYPPEVTPPSFKTGTLEWYRTVYRPEWDASGPKGKSSSLLQCMQGSGDLMYVPRTWWHATIALGEGIGVSGQFVRMTFTILRQAQEATTARRYKEASKLYRLVWNHRDDLEKDVANTVLLNIAVVEFYLGKLDVAEKAARKFLKLKATQHLNEQRRKAEQLIAQIAKARGQEL